MSEGSPTSGSRKHVSDSSLHSHTLARRVYSTITEYGIARDAEMRRGSLDCPPTTTMIEHHLQRSLFSELSRFRKPVLEREQSNLSGPPETPNGVAKESSEEARMQDICVVIERLGNQKHGESGTEAVENQNYEENDSEVGAGGSQDAASETSEPYDTGSRGWYGSNYTNGGGRFMECVLIIK